MTGIHIATILKGHFWEILLTPFEDTAKKEKRESRKRNLNKNKTIERKTLTQTPKDTIDKD